MVRDLLKGGAILIGLFAGLCAGLLIYWTITKTPDADVSLTRVDRDTTFYVGASENTSEGSTRFSVLAVGTLNSSGASVLVEYTKPPALATACALPVGQVDSLYQGDFYANRAKVTYRHGTVQHGHLRLRIALAYPPQEWGKHPVN